MKGTAFYSQPVLILKSYNTINMEVPCICINSKNRPKEVPARMWISEGMEYTITHVAVMLRQNRLQGVLLKEVQLKDCDPYEYYAMNRFAVRLQDLEKLVELISLCSELNHVDIEKLLEESQLEILEK